MARSPRAFEQIDLSLARHVAFLAGALRVNEAVVEFRLPRNKLFALMRAGELEYRKVGKYRLICRLSLARYLERQYRE